MKIIFENKNLNELKNIKETIDEVLKIDFKELEVTEENIKKAKEIERKVKSISKLYWNFKSVEAKIISSDGTELTKIY